MSSHIRKYISIACVALISLCLPAGAFGADDSSHARPRPEFTAEIKTLLASLDSLLAEAPRLDRAKQERIERNRRNYKAATDPDRRYWTASELYDEYCSYDSDSAMFYAERALDYARLMGRNDFIYDMELNRCYLFSATGMLAEADNCLSAVPPDSVPLRMATKYFERLLFLYNHRDQYTGVARDKDASARTLDSLVTEMRANLRPNSTDYGLMLGWSCLSVRMPYVRKILSVIDTVPYVWIGPPNWNEDTGINDMLARVCRRGSFFRSEGMTFERKKDKIHPTRKASELWAEDRGCARCGT